VTGRLLLAGAIVSSAIGIALWFVSWLTAKGQYR
jgi:hypothetical protein